ncbi:interferon-induced, double-stranded RNA-activated protein kinase [Erythrolamprus reginae]|uniref:interferon-induced, double-stranded RNA-activated protein kinase n=1 Tax=Erythrolamprus reginae TaxID=121349 RepID=UPI00396C95EC
MPDNCLDSDECMAKLNNYCQKNHFKLECQEIDATGPPHDRVFTIAIVINKVQYEPATGKSKKEAKTKAGVLAWKAIQNKGELDSCEQHNESKLSLLSQSDPELTSSNSINYVCWLNEYASKNKVRVQYNMISKTGLDHKPLFIYECQIGDKVFDVGRGNQVQAAKREAAKLAYEKLFSSSTVSAKECANSISDSSDTTFSSSQGLSSEASGISTDSNSELKKTSDTFTEHAAATQVTETSSFQNPVSPRSQSIKSKRKETPLAARFPNLRTSNLTKNSRFLEEFDDIESIGSGGFGNVFKAKNVTDDRVCAIKRILLSENDNEEKEVKALAKLNHNHIVQYYTCWHGHDIFQFPDSSDDNSRSTQHDCLFIIMELCEKQDLSKWLLNKNGVSDKDESIILFQQIVDGVDHIHSKNLIHRDLKPHNIFFYDENHLKIGDFGLVTSGVNDFSVQRTMNKGTPSYMAPEQKTPYYGKEVDIFSLGLILYEMLSPFSTYCEKAQEWPKIREGKIPEAFFKKFPEETSLIKKLLSKEQSKRPSAAVILKILNGQIHSSQTC